MTKRKMKWVVAAAIAMFASSMANAVPIAVGNANLDRNGPSQIFEIDAAGYDNLTLVFSAIGTGTIDPCGDFQIADCLAASVNGEDIVSGLSISNDWRSFQAFELPLANTAFELAFTARITGADEAMLIEWLLAGTELDEDLRVIVVSEPGLFALLGLGLAGFGFARRKKS